MKTIKVVFTGRKLTYLELAKLKKYTFVCDYPVKIGDLITSPSYNTPMQVVDITNVIERPEGPGGEYIKDLIVDKINDEQLKTNEEMPAKTSNDMFSGIMSKYTGQFVPQKEEKVRMSLTGLLCVPQDGSYIGVDSNNQLIEFPIEMTLPIPVYSIVKNNTALVRGDIIKNNNSYSKVIEVAEDGNIKTLSFSGYTHNKKPITDFVMGAATTRVLINMFNFDNSVGFNPLFFAMANGETLDVSSLMMLSMTPQGKNLFSNTGGGFNPMMLWMLDKNRGEGMNMATMMMMSSAMGGQNPFANMMPPTKPNADEALNTVLNNPDLLAKLKEALKDGTPAV